MSVAKKPIGEPLAVSQTEAARLLGVSDRTIRDWEKKKLVKGRTVNGGKRLYPYAVLKELAGVA